MLARRVLRAQRLATSRGWRRRVESGADDFRTVPPPWADQSAAPPSRLHPGHPTAGQSSPARSAVRATPYRTCSEMRRRSNSSASRWVSSQLASSRRKSLAPAGNPADIGAHAKRQPAACRSGASRGRCRSAPPRSTGSAPCAALRVGDIHGKENPSTAPLLRRQQASVADAMLEGRHVAQSGLSRESGAVQ